MLVLLLLVMLVGRSVLLRPSAADAQQDNTAGGAVVAPPAGLSDGHANAPLPGTGGPGVAVSSVLDSTHDKVQLRVLVIAADERDFMLPAWTQILDRLATPYDVLVASRENLVYDNLVLHDGTGKYSAVLLTTSQLVYSTDGGASWVHAFSDDEWRALWQYERDYGVREVDFYAYPATDPPHPGQQAYPQDFCLALTGKLDTTSAPLDAYLTDAGASVFTDLRPDARIPVHDAWVYLAKVRDEGCSATPILVDRAGNVLAAMTSSPDGRESIAVTFAQNPSFEFTQLLGYGLVHWATHGLYLGDLRFFLKVDIDDWGTTTDERLPNGTVCTDSPAYPGGRICPPFRLSASDALSAAKQQAGFRAAYPLAGAFKLDIAFNGAGLDPTAPSSCDPNVDSADPLSSVTACLANTFRWINHTYSHQLMDSVSVAKADTEITANDKVAQALRLDYSSAVLKTGGFSGLGYYYGTGSMSCPVPEPAPWGAVNTDYGLECSNRQFLQAAKNAGVHYIESNDSVAGQQPPCSNCAIRHPLEPDIMLLPEWPTSIHYWATTPQEEVSSYNALYGPGGTLHYFDHDLTYQEILANEAKTALHHLQTTVYPHYFHQSNLREYLPGRSLVFDWLHALVERYSALYRTPLLSRSWPALGSYVAQRTLHMEALAGTSAVWDRGRGTVTITAPGATPQPTPTERGKWVLFVTGIRTGHHQTYGADVISLVKLAPGSRVSAPVDAAEAATSPAVALAGRAGR